MSINAPAANKSRHSSPTNRTTRHSKDDALDDRSFELLLEGTHEMKPYYGFQARFCILVMGRLGLRRGELAHMQEDWIDWRRNMIEIPRHERCEKGEDGGVCGYCQGLARQRVQHADEDDPLTYEEALAETWRPKTDAAARAVPFDHDARAQILIERFFDRYDEYPCSCQSVNRRVDRAAEHAEELEPGDVYPHCLRASAASRLAAKGLDLLPMQAMLGWSDLSTAQVYIQQSGENTQRALHMVHSG